MQISGHGKGHFGFHPRQRMPWLLADNPPPQGTAWMGGSIGANTQIRQSKQGLAIISGRPSKPVTHQGSGCSGNLPCLQLVTRSSCLPLHPPTSGRWLDIERRARVFKERLQSWGLVRNRRPELEGTPGNQEVRLGEDGHVPGPFITVPERGREV